MARRSKVVPFLVAAPFVAYVAWVGNTGLLKGSAYIHRGFATEIWYSVTGGRYAARMECFGADGPRKRSLRAEDHGEATAFLEQAYPDCIILTLSRKR